jgi:hypothetical protein
MEKLALEITAETGIRLPKIIYVNEEELEKSRQQHNKESPHLKDGPNR